METIIEKRTRFAREERQRNAETIARTEAQAEREAAEAALPPQKQMLSHLEIYSSCILPCTPRLRVHLHALRSIWSSCNCAEYGSK